MPWVDVADDRVARPPRLPASDRTQGALPPLAEEPEIEIDDGWAEVTGIRVEGAAIDLRAATAVELTEVVLIGSHLQVSPEAELRVRGSRFEGCDLSQLRFDALRTSVLTQCKLMGAELTGVVADVEIVDSQLSLARFPEAHLDRVAFQRCTMREADFFDATLSDITFEECELERVNLDRAQFERVDLRYASTIDVRNAQDYGGCVITAVQAQAMALQLADSAGFGIEADPTIVSE